MGDYFVKRAANGKIVGPASGKQLKSLAQNGSLEANDEISKSQTGPWQTVRSVRGLESFFPEDDCSDSTSMVTKQKKSDVQRQSAPAREFEWFYAVGDEDNGPVGTAELASLFREGVIGAQSVLWRDGLEDWCTAQELPELAEFLQESSRSKARGQRKPPPRRSASRNEGRVEAAPDASGRNIRSAARPERSLNALTPVGNDVQSSIRSTRDHDVTQLDLLTFLVENTTYSDVFDRLTSAVSLHHLLAGSFKRSGIIRGSGESGISFVISVSDTDEGVVFEIDGDTPDGGGDFGVSFDPTSAEGWGLFGAVSLVNAAINAAGENAVQADIQRLSFNILHGLGATELLGLDDDTLAQLTATGVALLETGSTTTGNVVIRRKAKMTGLAHSITVICDGVKMGKVGNGGDLTLALPAGMNTIRLKGGMMKRELELEVQAGTTHEIECYFSELGVLGGGLVAKVQ
ncbi:MAG: hypothetical protein CMJ68_02405 [Planctomycetaceae bacterium]|nr:hypothetical protein [Planctomycetaceae bacterium]|tara:strand:- start:688 stop:2070 length:1383 start_codon:yes stop_codon:yes gene_type:complete